MSKTENMSQDMLFALLFSYVCIFVRTYADKNLQVTDATSKFNIQFLKNALEKTTGNLIVSPTSVYVLLAMVQQGAGGSSLEELNKILGAKSEETKVAYKDIISNIKNISDVDLKFANKVFIKTGFKVSPSYKNILVDYFLSDIESINFRKKDEAVQKINSWVSQQTNDRIKEIITKDKITSHLRLLLTNAIYFKRFWQMPFNKNDTQDGTFSPSPGQEVKVHMMMQKGSILTGKNSALDFSWIQLPFKGDRFVMLVILPNKKHGLDDLIPNLNDNIFQDITENNKTKRMFIFLPKFRISSQVDCVPTLKNMGLNDVLGESADLSGIAKKLFVSSIDQKAEIEIDEEGAASSVATSIEIHIKMRKPVFRADHPFLVVIMDKEYNIPLILGKIVDPTQT